MQLTPKDPDTEEYFNWDCSKVIAGGAGGTIASIVRGPFEEAGEGDGAITVLAPGAISSTGLVISAKLGGGTEDVSYALTFEFLTTMGEKLSHTIRFTCVNAID